MLWKASESATGNRGELGCAWERKEILAPNYCSQQGKVTLHCLYVMGIRQDKGFQCFPQCTKKPEYLANQECVCGSLGSAAYSQDAAPLVSL